MVAPFLGEYPYINESVSGNPEYMILSFVFGMGALFYIFSFFYSIKEQPKETGNMFLSPFLQMGVLTGLNRKFNVMISTCSHSETNPCISFFLFFFKKSYGMIF
ncbi:hypothetical protein CVT91_07655 [Candidatus Atribacteria bacterium HGW-Atribacteria-1]|nr:MAG: hypothetical protein CVT91_07655 [Candidatus Atribacteria bacterium HGW-Atribacteria-1]